MDAVQFDYLVKNLAATIAVEMKAGSGGGKSIPSFNKKLEEKGFIRLGNFDGDSRKWKEWMFNFKVICKGQNSKYGTIFKEAEGVGKYKEKETAEKLREALEAMQDDTSEGIFLEEYLAKAAEIFSMLCLTTTGEPNDVVRGAENQDGFLAWVKLCDRYGGKSQAGLLRGMMRVVRPGDVKDVKGVIKGVEEWERRSAELGQEYGENLSAPLKLAVFVGMLPKELQDEVYREIGLESKVDEERYRRVRDRIMGIAQNRIDQEIPTPMDIGNVGKEEEGYGWGEEEELEVDYVGYGSSCHRCGGKGHFARECGTPKGKGKGEKGKGKGDFGGKGKGKGEWGWKGGKDSKGKGKGDPGKGKGGGKGPVCWTCGKTGHKSDTC